MGLLSTAMSRVLFLLFVLFNFLSFFVFKYFVFFIIVSFIFSIWIFCEVKEKINYQILFIYIFLVCIFFWFSYGENPNDMYKRNIGISSGFYVLSGVDGLKRDKNPIYLDNKYILYSDRGKNKIVVSCSMLFVKCNIDNYIGDKVYIKYVRYCLRAVCSNYIYEFKGRSVFDDKYFINRYDKEVELNNLFVWYLIFNTLFVVAYVVFLRHKIKDLR